MYRAGNYVAAVLACLLAATAIAEEAHTISATGNAKSVVKPDVAFITFYVKGDGILMVDAAKKTDKLVEEVINAVREGRAETLPVDIQTASIGEKGGAFWNEDMMNKPPAPQIVKRLRVTCPPDAALVYGIIDSAIRAGATLSIGSDSHFPGEPSGVVVFGLMDHQDVVADLDKKALADARESAERYAAVAGKRVGNIISIGCEHEGSTFGPSFYFDHESDFPTHFLGSDIEKLEVVSTKKFKFELLDS